MAGDASQNQRVDRRDARVVRAYIDRPLDQLSENFVLDLDLDGTIGLGDAQMVRMNKGHEVP